MVISTLAWAGWPASSIKPAIAMRKERIFTFGLRALLAPRLSVPRRSICPKSGPCSSRQPRASLMCLRNGGGGWARAVNFLRAGRQNRASDLQTVPRPEDPRHHEHADHQEGRRHEETQARADVGDLV